MSEVAEQTAESSSEVTEAPATPAMSSEANATLDRWEAIGKEDVAAQPGSQSDAVPTAEAKQPETPALPEQPKTAEVWTPKQIHAIQRAGYSPADLAGLPDGGKAFVERAEQMFRDQGAAWARRGREIREAPPAAVAPAEPAKPEGFKLNLDPDRWTPEAVTELQTALQPVFEQANRYSQLAQRWEYESLRREVDEVFSDLAETVPAYGTGPARKLTEDNIKARAQVCVLAEDMMIGAKQDGRELTAPDALRAAHAAIHADQMVKGQRAKISEQIGKRSGQITSRPTQRKTTDRTQTVEEKAMDSYARRAQELGIEDV